VRCSGCGRKTDSHCKRESGLSQADLRVYRYPLWLPTGTLSTPAEVVECSAKGVKPWDLNLDLHFEMNPPLQRHPRTGTHESVQEIDRLVVYPVGSFQTSSKKTVGQIPRQSGNLYDPKLG
jgi:hypothetical protein